MAPKKTIKVGFDLDGVLLYNPARNMRAVIKNLKKSVFHANPRKFYVPQKPWEQMIWKIFHLSSIFVAPGYDEAKNLIKDGKIEAYLITARYDFLLNDLKKWIKKLEIDTYFKEYYYNKDNKQPHLYKEETIRKLKLDYFIEDNWDIVNYLHQTFKPKNLEQPVSTKVYWITNLLDNRIEYAHKFLTFKDAVKNLKDDLDLYYSHNKNRS